MAVARTRRENGFGLDPRQLNRRLTMSCDCGPLRSFPVRANMGAWVRAGAQSALGQYDRTVLGPGTPATEHRGRPV